MRIGVLSDTHSRALPKEMIEDLKKTDLIIHAGDFCSSAVLEELKSIQKVEAVYGNMDDKALRHDLPRSRVIQCGSYAIGIFHGEGHPDQLIALMHQEFADKKVDAIVFGHSHHPMNEMINGVLFFNPGSPTDTVFAPYRSYGILELNGIIRGRIVKINDT